MELEDAVEFVHGVMLTAALRAGAHPRCGPGHEVREYPRRRIHSREARRAVRSRVGRAPHRVNTRGSSARVDRLLFPGISNPGDSGKRTGNCGSLAARAAAWRMGRCLRSLRVGDASLGHPLHGMKGETHDFLLVEPGIEGLGGDLSRWGSQIMRSGIPGCRGRIRKRNPQFRQSHY